MERMKYKTEKEKEEVCVWVGLCVWVEANASV